MQLQLSLTLADELYDLLLLKGEPVEYLEAASHLLALNHAPPGLCREAMDALVKADHRFCWSSPGTLGLVSWRVDDPDLSDCPFVVVDLETTGTRAGPGKITEIGAVRIEGLREVAVFETLVNPKRPIHPKVIEITGITPQMVVNAPPIEQVMPHFLDFIRGAVIVAHNTAFDLSFLNYELGRLKGRRLGEGAIDTVLLARRAAPGLANYRLGTVAECLGSEVRPCHRALADAQATAHVFLTLVGRLQEQGITRLGDLRVYVDPSHKGDRRKLALTDHLPREPGTYFFKDESGNILYVGKAESLRDRVRSYFLSGASHTRKVRQALRRLHEVGYEQTATPLEALIREQELILEHRPPANVHGRRPENYVYLKLTPSPLGSRLYVSDRFASRAPARPLPPAAAFGDVVVLGPFRSRSRAAAAVDLLHRCYPIRRCSGSKPAGACLYQETGRCLSPCRGGGPLEEHEDLLSRLLHWLTSTRPGPGGYGDDGQAWEEPALNGYLNPDQAARKAMGRLAGRRRYEEAQRLKEGLEGLRSVRRSYAALNEACSLRFAAIWPARGGTDLSARINLIWDGRPAESVTVTPATAPLEVGRLVRSLTEPPARAGFVAVPQQELDFMLTIRRWYREESSDAIVLPGPSCDDTSAGAAGREKLAAWRKEILTALTTCWEEGHQA
ncbi:MAG: DEDD exonuclease domain-containing protein [Thermoleophilia bacterium]